LLAWAERHAREPAIPRDFDQLWDDTDCQLPIEVMSKPRVLQSCIGVFVADHIVACWEAQLDATGTRLTWKPLVQLARWQEHDTKHVLRCRFNAGAKKTQLALQIDDSEVFVLKLLEFPGNSRIGIWGCHGTCDFYEIQFLTTGTLPWEGEPLAE